MNIYGYGISKPVATAYNFLESETKASLAQIERHARNKEFNKLDSALNEFCGENGHAEINVFKGKFQVHLFFDSESKRDAAMKILPTLFKGHGAPTHFQDYQTQGDNYLFPLRLATHQSVALIGKNVRYESAYEEGQDILKSTIEMNMQPSVDPFPLMQLPTDIVQHMTSLIPLRTLGNIAQASQFNHTLLDDSNKHLWTSVAQNLNIHLNPESAETPKKQIKKNSEIHLDKANIDQQNHTIKMKVSQMGPGMPEFFEEYLVNMYLKDIT